MDLQQIFDAALNGIRAQGKQARRPSTTGKGLCAYRADQPDGTVLKCGIGVLMRDEDYNPVFDTDVCGTVNCVMDNYYNGCGEDALEPAREFIAAMDHAGVNLLDPKVRELCEAIQTAHDLDNRHLERDKREGLTFLQQFEDEMRTVAIDFSLKYEAPAQGNL